MAMENETKTDSSKTVIVKKEPEKEPEAKAAPIQKVEAKTEAASAMNLAKPGETKVKFLVWFTGALKRFDNIQAHHMTTIRAYFQHLGLGDPQTQNDYDQGLIKFGFGRKEK
jgi:hypothetical protein